MRLSRSEVSPLLTYPIQPQTASRESALAALSKVQKNGSSSAPSREALASLIDLVADHRSDLLRAFLDVLSEATSTREHAQELTDLVAACGVEESRSPCATAMAIAADLEKLARASSRWTHPAQIVRNPNAGALNKLCAMRIERAASEEHQRLKEVLPRLARAARLTERAASRRIQEAVRQQKQASFH